MSAPSNPAERAATARPWFVYTGAISAHGYGTTIDAPDGSSVAFVASDNTQADAELIVRAVNAHDSLVAGLRDLVDECPDVTEGTWRRAKEALAKAEGRQS